MDNVRFSRMILQMILIFMGAAGPGFAQKTTDRSYTSLSSLPILMYDNDIGWGFGGKIKFVNYLGKKESFDLVLFNSSRGERWSIFTFSIPDIEIRQNKVYGLSFDLKAEYDKYLKYKFYGVGPDSKKEQVTAFSYEKKILHLTFGHSFTREVIVEASYVLRSVNYFNVEDNKAFTDTLKQFGKQFVPYASLAVRYDTSNSQIHPTRGMRLLIQDDIAAGLLGSRDSSYNRLTAEFRKYLLVFGNKDVFAVRGLIQYISGARIPLFDLASLGGGTHSAALRGYGLNRFLDKGKFLANAEYRFPIWRQLGGNVFIDSGTVWPSLSRVDFGRIALDAGLGLRFYLPDFCIRMDIGFSREGAGLYFNFGHLF